MRSRSLQLVVFLVCGLFGGQLTWKAIRPQPAHLKAAKGGAAAGASGSAPGGGEEGDTSWCDSHDTLPNGAFCKKYGYSGTIDESLASQLGEVFMMTLSGKLNMSASVADFGAGAGLYTARLKAKGFTARAFDASPVRGAGVEYLDLTRPLEDSLEVDWALCLEVGEYIPPQFEEALLDNLVNSARHGVVLAWTPPGQEQGSPIQVLNRQSAEYLSSQMRARGLVPDHGAEKFLRKQATFAGLKETLLVFRDTENTSQRERHQSLADVRRREREARDAARVVLPTEDINLHIKDIRFGTN